MAQNKLFWKFFSEKGWYAVFSSNAVEYFLENRSAYHLYLYCAVCLRNYSYEFRQKSVWTTWFIFHITIFRNRDLFFVVLILLNCFCKTEIFIIFFNNLLMVANLPMTSHAMNTNLPTERPQCFVELMLPDIFLSTVSPRLIQMLSKHTNGGLSASRILQKLYHWLQYRHKWNSKIFMNWTFLSFIFARLSQIH